MNKPLKRLSVVSHVFTARFPTAVWEALRSAAKARGVSINAEMMRALAATYGVDPGVVVPEPAAPAPKRPRGRPRKQND